jgi:exoribonuclease II
MVAEAMILANSTWGQWLAECGVPGIYRSQASLAPGVKVRMGTKAQPHAGIGVQLRLEHLAAAPLCGPGEPVADHCLRPHGKTPRWRRPFKPKDANLLAVISAFDAAYTAYNGFQNGMERYWTLQHLQQKASAN